MSKLFISLFAVSFFLNFSIGLSQGTKRKTLHLQVYTEGVCLPMTKAVNYEVNRTRIAKNLLQSYGYYSTIYAIINSKDSGDFNPQSNHQLQSSSISLDSERQYELILLNYRGFIHPNPDSMVISISKLETDAQVIIAFKKGRFSLKKMKLYKKLNPEQFPNFNSLNKAVSRNTLKLDSMAYFKNGKIKAKYYRFADNFPLYFVEEFDFINPRTYSCGFRLIQNYSSPFGYQNKPIWGNTDVTKYGYWKYFVNGEKIGHELWASTLQEKYQWHSNGQLKYASKIGYSNKPRYYICYHESGKIKEEFIAKTTKNNPSIKKYHYSKEGKLLLINTYYSNNGISKQSLIKREIFYPSGKLKMEENFLRVYTIKYYNEDGTERKN